MTRLIALVGIITISFSAIFVRLADVSPTTAAFYRTAYAIPALLIVRALVVDERTPRERLIALGAGAFFSIDLVLWHLSIEYIGAGLSTVVANSQVLWVAILAWVLLKEKPSRTAFTVVPVVLIGITLIGGLGRDDAYGSNPALGVMLALFAGVSYAGFLMVLRSATRRKTHPVGPLLDATAGAAVILLVVSLFDPALEFAIHWPSHGWLLLLGVLIQAFGWLLISTVLPRLPALDTSVMLLLQPALTVMWAQVVFSETLSAVQWLGVVIVLGGILGAGIRGVADVRRAGVPATPDL